MEIRPLDRSEYDAAARIFADAFSTIPVGLPLGRIGVGGGMACCGAFIAPRSMSIHRYGRPIYGAFDDGRLVGVAATFAAGLYPRLL